METCIMLGDQKAYIYFDKYNNLNIQITDENGDLKEIFGLAKVTSNIYVVTYGNTNVSDHINARILSRDMLDSVFECCGSELMSKHSDLLIKHIKMIVDNEGGKTI